MESKKVSVLKFVGTISLGLMTGASYTLSSFAVPSLLELPSASTAARTFRSLSTAARIHLKTLSGVAASAFLLSFVLSPSDSQHPYLLYTTVVCCGSGLSDYIAPAIFGKSASSSSSSSAAAQKRAALSQARKDKRAPRGMDASYEVLGDSHSDEGAASNSGGEELLLEEEINGEEVRGDVVFYRKAQLLQTAISGIAFAMAVVGIWGDGVKKLYIIKM